jgi:hypothetical protein
MAEIFGVLAGDFLERLKAVGREAGRDDREIASSRDALLAMTLSC